MADGLVRWRCESLGLVQRVGYRDRVRRAAKELGLVDWIENDPQDEDRVVFGAQGPEPALQRLLIAVRGPIGMGDARSVHRLEALPVEPTWERFTNRRDPDSQKAMAKRMDEAALYLGASFEVGRETLGVSKESLAVGKGPSPPSRTGTRPSSKRSTAWARP